MKKPTQLSIPFLICHSRASPWQERHWMGHIDRSFLLKSDTPLSTRQAHSRLSELVTHMRIKFRTLAQELVQRLTMTKSCVEQQLQSTWPAARSNWQSYGQRRRGVVVRSVIWLLWPTPAGQWDML